MRRRIVALLVVGVAVTAALVVAVAAPVIRKPSAQPAARRLIAPSVRAGTTSTEEAVAGAIKARQQTPQKPTHFTPLVLGHVEWLESWSSGDAAGCRISLTAKGVYVVQQFGGLIDDLTGPIFSLFGKPKDVFCWTDEPGIQSVLEMALASGRRVWVRTEAEAREPDGPAVAVIDGERPGYHAYRIIAVRMDRPGGGTHEALKKLGE